MSEDLKIVITNEQSEGRRIHIFNVNDDNYDEEVRLLEDDGCVVESELEVNSSTLKNLITYATVGDTAELDNPALSVSRFNYSLYPALQQAVVSASVGNISVDLTLPITSTFIQDLNAFVTKHKNVFINSVEEALNVVS